MDWDFSNDILYTLLSNDIIFWEHLSIGHGR